MTHPTTTREWFTAGVALGVLGVGAVLASLVGAEDGLSVAQVVTRCLLVFLFGFVAAAVWWAMAWLRDHGYPRGNAPPP